MKKLTTASLAAKLFLTLGAFASLSGFSGGNDCLHTTIIHSVNGKSLNNVKVDILLGKLCPNETDCCEHPEKFAELKIPRVQDGLILGIPNLFPKGYSCVVEIYRHDYFVASDAFELITAGDKYIDSRPRSRNINLK